MSFIANLETQAETIAGKAGIPPDKVKAIAQSLQNKLKAGTDKTEALEATAREHGVTIDKVKEVLGHAGLSGELDKVGEFTKGIFG